MKIPTGRRRAAVLLAAAVLGGSGAAAVDVATAGSAQAIPATGRVCNYADPYSAPNLAVRYSTGAHGTVPAGQCSSTAGNAVGWRPPITHVSRYHIRPGESMSTRTCSVDSSWVFCSTMGYTVIVTSTTRK